MRKIIEYIRLPKEDSPTEKAHVERINRIAIVAFYAHIPLFMWVAWLCDTKPLQALFLSLAVLIGPTIAYWRLKDFRTIAHVFAFTTMCLGGLLVHYGQGPMQIEMHFYFFTLLALLASYGNPAVNVTAAVTAAVHHLTLWILLPSSIFNYDASIWVVAVHATFVVVETVAAVFIARSFYDNVIGLEKIVAARTAEVDQRNKDMRLVLDHVDQGLMTIDPAGRFGDERSAKVEEWLGAPPASGSFVDWLREADKKAAAWLEIGLEEIGEDILPLEVVLAQLPQQFRKRIGEKRHTFALAYQPIEDDDGKLQRILLVISDITSELERAAAEAEQKETLRLFEIIAADADGFKDFFAEASKMMRVVVTDPNLELRDVKRILHTLKGNTAMYGLDRISKRVHEIEDAVEASGDRPSAEDLASMDVIWSSIEEKVEQLSGGERKTQMLVERADVSALIQAVREAEDYGKLEKRIQRMHMEPSNKRLAILADQARKIAERLGRRNLTIEMEGDREVRFDAQRWTAFWSSLVHVFRNSVDHGLEPEEERKEAGKSPNAKIALKTYTDADSLVVVIEDDGRGIDIDKLAARAKAAGLPADTTEQILEAVFADGISSRDVVSETSGRGVGMAAVKAEAEALGGEIQVETEAGRGTVLRFVFPIEATEPVNPALTGEIRI